MEKEESMHKKTAVLSRKDSSDISEYKSGDLVMLTNQKRSSKSAPKYAGPFEVVQENYVIVIDGKEKTVHAESNFKIFLRNGQSNFLSLCNVENKRRTVVNLSDEDNGSIVRKKWKTPKGS